MENDAQTLDTQDQAQAEPTTLEEAIKAIRGSNSGSTADLMVAGSMAEGKPADERSEHDDGEVEEANTSSEGSEQSPDSDVDAIQHDAVAEIGGHSDVSDASEMERSGSQDTEANYVIEDYKDLQRNLVDSVRRQAAMAANQKFEEAGLSKITLSSLYNRDENTGRVTFVNPDNPDRPFESRSEAQAWVDSYNKEIEAEWVNYANEMQKKFAQDTLPAARLIQFAPVYDKMDDQTKQVFDTIIEPYSVKDSSGMVIGYSCDLSAAHDQARKLVGVFGSSSGNISQSNTESQQPAVPASGGPALDAVTSGTGTASESDEPKNLQEAFKLLNKQKKEKK